MYMFGFALTLKEKLTFQSYGMGIPGDFNFKLLKCFILKFGSSESYQHISNASL